MFYMYRMIYGTNFVKRNVIIFITLIHYATEKLELFLRKVIRNYYNSVRKGKHLNYRFNKEHNKL